MSVERAVYFDLDGTLTDPKPGITRSIRHALECLGIEPPLEDDLTWCIGPPLPESLAILVGGDRAEAALGHFRERFSAVGLYENALYPRVVDMLERLREAGFPLFVASSKPRVFVERIVAHFEIDGYFASVYGSELDGTRMDKTALLAYAVAETGLPRSRSIMVGDREHDGIGAGNNGLAFVGVEYGYGSVEELVGADARAIARSPSDVAEIVIGLG